MTVVWDDGDLELSWASSATEIGHNDGSLRMQRLQFINDNIFCSDPASSIMTQWGYLLFSSNGRYRQTTFKMAKKTSDFNRETVHIDYSLTRYSCS